MYDYYLFPLPRASKWNRPNLDPSEVKIDLYFRLVHPAVARFTERLITYLSPKTYPTTHLRPKTCLILKICFKTCHKSILTVN